MMSESNKQQAVNKLTEIVANFTAMISTRMPDDVVDKLKQLKDAETSSMGENYLPYDVRQHAKSD
ncbi:L(+)-tartrate dehydratase subunit alpha [Escherichia coli]|uniref:L(+)-tartrate dehydratase subunit alpha n=1 Tax=Escherichia coli TaxID=562 RepID=A0A376KL51_ECOLX|nr:L(+)-tartrate dehydratase subunit alpha [Escherichia coli]